MALARVAYENSAARVADIDEGVLTVAPYFESKKFVGYGTLAGQLNKNLDAICITSLPGAAYRADVNIQAAQLPGRPRLTERHQ